MASNSPQLTGKMLRFIEIASSMGKEAMDRIEELEGHQKQASENVSGLVEHLIETKVIDPGQKQAAENALRDHGQTQLLLKNAASKIKEIREKSAAANVSGLGQGEGPTKEASAHDPNNSLTSPFVGQRSTEKKASDVALFKALGLPIS
jgi:hypothetical protein